MPSVIDETGLPATPSAAPIDGVAAELDHSPPQNASFVVQAEEMGRGDAAGGTGDALEDFGRAFRRVVEAGRSATRQIDGAELREKSAELRGRCDAPSRPIAPRTPASPS